MGSEPGTALPIVWISEANPFKVGSEQFEDLRIRHRAVVLRDWLGEDQLLIDHEELFGLGPARALILRVPERPATILLVGEEGSELLELDLAKPDWCRRADLPRSPNEVGGMCFVDVLSQNGMTLLHWELGILALGPSSELVWRHDLEWNHTLISLDEHEVWFDLMYESADVPVLVGEAPWGFSLDDGRDLFDRVPPDLQP
jgi:hypothetical protein